MGTEIATTTGIPPAAIKAAQRGDAKGLLDALGGDALAVANFALEVRRQSVSVIGNHEAFVRHTPDGSLEQVLRPVRLSLHDNTLYQIPTYDKVERRSYVKEPNKANLTYPGYMALNAVAGCAVGQPPVVIVDGEERTNPFVDRAPSKGGRVGAVRRVVIAVCVVGPAPATGNPVVVNYTLDYDPSKELSHMLGTLADNYGKGNTDVYLALEDEVNESRKPGWAFLPVSDGVGWYYNLGLKEVVRAYKDYVNLQGMAMKKAQTVARRNAMKSHPALGLQTVQINDSGWTTVPVLGWAGDNRAMSRWHQISEALSRGMEIPDADKIEVIHSGDVYDVEEHDAGVDHATASHDLTPEEEERNALVAYIDQGILSFPGVVADLGYDPESMDNEQLRAVKDELDNAAQEQA